MLALKLARCRRIAAEQLEKTLTPVLTAVSTAEDTAILNRLIRSRASDQISLAAGWLTTLNA